uniref:High mobility group box n=1 Tax=Iridovirus LCIVAC01 TaxID=2506607 RepID=A0A481YQV0_9VIRU|nr:MAG: high mobility group box [Iridovirus LCIVAC01]
MNSFFANVIAGDIQESFEKVHEKFISLIVEKYNIDLTELEELLETACKEEASEVRTKQKKLKNKLPRKVSGYQIFNKERRAQFKNEQKEKKQPVLPFGKISKILGTMWKELSEEERTSYNNRAQAINEEINKNEKTNKKNEKTNKKNEKTNKNEKKAKKNPKAKKNNEKENKKICIALLQSGKREGEECGAKVAEDSEFCKRHNKPKKAKKQNKNEKKTKQDEMTIPTEDEIDSSYSSEIDELIIEESDSEKHVHFSDEDEARIIEEDPTTEYVGKGFMRRPKPRDPTVRYTGKSRSLREDRWD